MLSETLQELGLARRPRVPARRVAELSRSASPAGPHFPDDLETGAPPAALPPTAGAPGAAPGAAAAAAAAAGDVDPQGLASLDSGRLGAAAAASAGGVQSGSSGGSGAAEALISQIARQQLELAFRQTHSGASEAESASHAAPQARHPLALESLDDAGAAPAAPGRAQLVRRAAAGAAAAGGGDSSEWASSHHSQQQQQHAHHQQQHQIAPSEATDTEQVLQPLIPARGGPDGAAPASSSSAAAAPPGGIPRSIVVLSCVSMALTSASCVFNTLLPIYMVAELKLTMRSLGMFEGVLEAFSYVVRMFSGVLSDRMASRKAAIAAGFAMGAAAKCGMSFATTIGQLFIGKAMDRLGNGVQAAPRDALIGDLSPPTSRSACFGFAQAMRKWGSFMGAGLVFALMKATDNNYQAIFLGAAGVSALATLAFVFFVPSHPSSSQQQQKDHHPQQQGKGQQQQQQQRKDAGSFGQQARALWRDVRGMGSDFYRTLAVIGLYGLGHINESMLEARAIEVGFGKAEATLVVALLCLSVSFCAYPLGRLDDKYGPRTTFALGMAALVAGDLVLLASGAWPPAVFVACVFWGVHWAVVQGPMLGVVVSLAPPHLKGTAFGIFYSLMAVTAMAANTVFGSIWHTHGAEAAFGLSAAVISATALFALPRLLPPRRGGAVAAAPAAA